MAIDEKSNYYDEGGIEVISIIKAKLTPEQYEGFLLGNALKYLCRVNFKGDKERDIEKAAVYLSLAKKEFNNNHCLDIAHISAMRDTVEGRR